MAEKVSIAIETSCRFGGVALGVGARIGRVIDFDASARHATQLVGRLDELLGPAALTPGDLDEIYVCAGPGSFTGLRVGITVARTLGQMVPKARCVAVPTPLAVAENARHLPWQRLGVVLDAKEELIYVQLFERREGEIVPAGPPGVVHRDEFAATVPKPVTLCGEGLLYHPISAPGVGTVDPELFLPTARGVWLVGQRLAAAGQFTPYQQLLPIYARKPEAVRLWDSRHGTGGD